MANASLPGPMPASSKIKSISLACILIGAATFAMMLFKDKDRAWHGYLTAYYYFFILGIGGLFFTSIHHVSSAGWSVNVRRYCECFTAYLPIAFVGALALLAGGGHLYEWMDKAKVAEDALLQHKAGYLNIPFFVVRLVLFFSLWLLFSKKLVGSSLEQDKSGSEDLTHRAKGWSIGFLLFFALSFSFFSVDLLMSLQPHWFSTIFGIYCFGGLFQATIAAMIVLIVISMKQGLLKGVVDENHLHDLGKYLFAFTVFWAYIAYSQYMLIWYANMPEETIFFIPRVTGSWMWVSAALVMFKFVVPFLALLPRWVKRSPNHLLVVSILILVMHYVDIYWLVYPNLTSESVVFGLPEVLIWLGFAGAFMLFVMGFLNRHPLVPGRDPRIHESLHHHVTY